MADKCIATFILTVILIAGASGIYSVESVPEQNSISDCERPITSPESTETVKAGAKRIPDGYVYWKTVRARVTAYDPSRVSCGSFADGRTSTGRNAWQMDGCAIYPSAIPYGTLVSIPGVGVRKADDTGAQMRRSWRRGIYHIDVRMTYPYEARRWGNQYMEVKLYRKSA